MVRVSDYLPPSRDSDYLTSCLHRAPPTPSLMEPVSGKRKQTADSQAFLDAVLAIPLLLEQFTCSDAHADKEPPPLLRVNIQRNCLTVIRLADWVVDGRYQKEVSFLEEKLAENLGQLEGMQGCEREDKADVAAALQQVLDAIRCLHAENCQLGQSKRRVGWK